MVAEICPQNALVVADGLAGESTHMSDPSGASTRAVERLGKGPGEGSSSGPRAKTARVADSDDSVEQIQKFDAFSSRSHYSRPSAASGKNLLSAGARPQLADHCRGASGEGGIESGG